MPVPPYETALIVGAGEGLSASLARLLARNNMRIALAARKVEKLAAGEAYVESREPARCVEIPNDWYALVGESAEKALAEQSRIQKEFEAAFAAGLVSRGFVRDEHHPKYLLYEE